jgi:hypothetical protein
VPGEHFLTLRVFFLVPGDTVDLTSAGRLEMEEVGGSEQGSGQVVRVCHSYS